jgi:hypothetical protein
LEARDLFYLFIHSKALCRGGLPMRRCVGHLRLFLFFFRKRESLENPSAAEAICECASPSRRSLTCAPALYTEPLKDKAIRRWNCEGRGWGAQSLTVSVLWKYLGYILVV